MKKLLLIALMLLAIQLQAQVRIGYAEAFSTAEKFVSQQGKPNKHTLTLSEEIKSKLSGQTNLFVFSMKPKGYVIVSAMDEVLAYSFESTMPPFDELPDPISYWLDLYNEQTDYLIEHPEQLRKPTKSQNAVDPLLTSVWGQGCYHNQLCPMVPDGPCNHASAGCVAIAMAQIMHYHKQPLTGNGKMTYSCSPFGNLSANFGGTTYLWEEMTDTLQDINYAVATLVFHCGVSVQMNYGAHSSTSSSAAACDAFQQFFFYPFATYSHRYKFSDEAWTALIKHDLDNHYPVYYEGKSNIGSHAFVCDGYDSNNMFHFNFGWDGVADGYYTLDNPNGFSMTQACIHNIIPLSDFQIQSDSHGIVYVTPDGNGDGSSWENATSDLQTAIFKSHFDKTTIWVKEGIYTRESASDYAFNMLGDCQLYGGFKGDEPYDYDLSLRDFEAHPSIFDGNHSHGIFKMQNASNLVLLDGFTIQNGAASKGGGVYAKCQTRIRNCKFCFNYSNTNGGGLLLQSTGSGRTIVLDCEFFGNEAKNYGGAVNDIGNVTYHRCQFHDNVSHTEGGGVYSHSFYSPSKFVNCTFCNNMAKTGGGIATIKQGTTLWNCLINNNTAETGGGCYFRNGANLFSCTIVKNEAQVDYGGVYMASSSQDGVQNCIIWGNTSPGENLQFGPTATYSNCAVENDLSDTLNFKAETDNDGDLPRFYVRFRNPDVDAGATGYGGDWRLQSNSLCINRGVQLADQPSTDLDGNPRCQHGKTDLGVYESDVDVHFINAYYCEDEPCYYQDSLLSELGFYTFLEQTTPYENLYVVTLQQPPPTVFLYEKICKNDTYDFFGTLLSETGQYTITNRCVTYNLKLTVMPLDSITMDEEICEGETYDFFGRPLQETGHYSTIVDCKNYELDLIVKPISEALLPMEEEICEDETYDFFGRVIHSGGHYSTTVNCVTYELDLTVLPRPLLQCSNDTLVEYGNLIQLTASGADSYLWSTGDTTESIIIYPVVDRRYSVTGFSKNGCSTEASVMVSVSNEVDEMVVYPNPASNKVEIFISLIDEVEVLNLLGTRIEHVNANREVVELDVSHYDSGVYILHAKCLNNHYYKKLIIQH